MIDSCLPAPFLFNDLKHHLGNIRSLACNSQISKDYGLRELSERLQIIGSCATDIYTGILSPSDIGSEIANILINADAFTREKYLIWINKENRAWKKITISDGSEWTLLPSKSLTHYIHIHPGRASSLRLRVKGNILKCTMLYLLFINMPNYKLMFKGNFIETINFLRKHYLDLSPILPGQIDTIKELIALIQSADANAQPIIPHLAK
ncbi:MAG TPA: hypothetical protein DCM62_07340 [Bacteroidales bacterium]|nr:hypothetical protein [Bacteroidales bacterium]